MSDPSIRINKYIADSGFCSRREADTYIEQGKVTINGKIAVLGDRVSDTDEIQVNGNPITKNQNLVYIAFNKPIGITTTGDSRVKKNVIDFINHPERIFYIGRLDKASEGLLLLTNDGDIVNKILRAGNKHEKEYIVKVNRPITDDFIKKMGNGVPILGTVTKRCFVEKLSRYTFRIILVQGLNRQIRRMTEYFGYDITSLQRTRIMHIELEGLKIGSWRNLTQEEVKLLKEAIKDSDNESFKMKQHNSYQENENRNLFGKRRRRR